ncbi:unnamed protein product [Phaeothamnion confervicola]
MMAVKSKAIPFMPAPKGLDDSMPGYAGFDPLGLSAIDGDFLEFMVPKAASMREGIVDASYWMREAEIKHCRLAMLAVAGWVAVDMGLRLPGSKYVDLTSISAHDAMVSSGNMVPQSLPHVPIAGAVMLLEIIGGAAIFQAANGSGRQPGVFYFDPLGLAKDPAKSARYATSEIKNGRLAMLAFGGIATQSVLTGHSFPYLF